MFERFWQIYPRKVSRGAALKAWTKLNPNVGLAEEIIKAVERQKEWRARVEKSNEVLQRWRRTFVPHWKHPATWLNQQCWLDEVPDVPTPKAKGKITCMDCGKDYTVRYNNVPYCTRCYDRHAHPELRSTWLLKVRGL